MPRRSPTCCIICRSNRKCVRRIADRALRTRAASPHGGDSRPVRPRLAARRGEGFGWDNEFEQHEVEVPAFAIAQHKVTNGDYLEFVKAGAAAPHFWICREGEWCYHGMFEDIPLPLDWPVYVSYDEAQAYARWKGKALPTEAQFHRAAYDGERGLDRFAGENVDFRSWDPEPVTASPPNRYGVSQMVGNGWEWTAHALRAVPRLPALLVLSRLLGQFLRRPALRAERRVAAHRPCLLRSSFRNWFRPAYPYIYATFRLVEINPN